MSYAKYRALIALPYPNAAGSDASATQAAALDMPPAEAAAEPNSCTPDRDGAGPFAGTLLRQPAVVESRDVAAEWGDDPLDADGDTKRLSRLEVGGANPPYRRVVAQQESASQSDAPTLSYEEEIAQLEALLQGHRDLDESGRDITDVRLIHADPPPAFLRRTG